MATPIVAGGVRNSLHASTLALRTSRGRHVAQYNGPDVDPCSSSPWRVLRCVTNARAGRHEIKAQVPQH